MPLRHARGLPLAFAGPAVAVMLFGLLYPVAEAFRLSFYELRLGEPVEPGAYRGLAIFAEALADPSTRASMLVTLAYAAVVVAVEMALGVGLALLLEAPIRGKGRIMGALRTLFVLPMMIAPICVGLIWRYLFDAGAGPINAALAPLGVQPVWLADPTLSFVAICVADVWQFTPFVFIMALAGLQGLDPSAVEAARLDGASAWQTIVLIKLPLIAPILTITLLMRVIDAVRGLEVVYAMTNGGPGQATELFPLYIYKSAFVTQRMGQSAALSVCLLAVTTLLSGALLAWSNPIRGRGA